jgi:cellulose synthase (UDP-forming)
LLVAARYTLLLLACITAAFYFLWRIDVPNPAHPVYSWIVLAAELAGFARALMFLFSAARVTHREPASAVENLAVDVFVTTYGEPVDVVRRTVRAALEIRYPHETWLLDDGGRPELLRLAAELGCRYLARAEHSDAKAGNLNHALSIARGAFVVLFDADHVADPQFLDRTLGYFADERVAFVQTPQEFYNADSFEHLRAQRRRANVGSFFHYVVQQSRDAVNATIFTGSSAVFRRRALDDIAGFATGTISEDIHTSLRLHAAGWRSVFHPELLSAEMGPLDGAAFRGQRLRWAQDALQVLVLGNIVARPGLTSSQRFAYLIHIASNLEGWRHLFIYALPIAILVTGILPVQTDATTFLMHFGPYFVATTLALAEFTRGHGRPDESAVYNLARTPMAIVAAFTAQREHRFRVTPKARVRQSGRPEHAFTDALILLTLGSMAFAAAEVWAGRSPFPPATLAVLFVWGAYHVVTATRLLVLEHRCARDRRSTARLADDIPVALTPIGESQTPYALCVVSASADGFSLRACDGTPPPAGAYQGTLDIDGAQFPFELALRELGLGGSVRWSDDATRASVDLRLYQRTVRRLAARV